jgi:histone deacetylase complex regulatory component SIN3
MHGLQWDYSFPRSPHGDHTFLCLQYLEIFVPLRQTLFLETARSQLEGEQGGCSISIIDLFGQKLIDRERLVSRSIVIMKNSNVGPKFRLLSTNGFK